MSQNYKAYEEKKVSFFLSLSLYFTSNFIYFYWFLSFWLKSKTKNAKRERSGVLRSVTNLRRLQEAVPNGSVYPWVSAQCRLTYFNYGLRVCCAPWRIHGLGLTGEPKLSGGRDYFWPCMLMGCCVLAVPGVPSLAFLPEQMPQDGGGVGSFVPPDMLRPWPGGQRSSAAAASSASRGDVRRDLWHHPLIRMSLNSCHVVPTFCHGWQRWD